MVSMSVVAVPIFLCAAAIVSTLISWRINDLSEIDRATHRSRLFRAGTLCGAVGLIVTGACFLDPFPLSRGIDGSLSVTWLDRAWATAFLLSACSAVLAFFGRGKARLLLLGTEIFAFVLTAASVLQNGV